MKNPVKQAVCSLACNMDGLRDASRFDFEEVLGNAPGWSTMIASATKLLCLMMMLTMVSPIQAQSFYGSVVGTVTDSSGGVIPGASVTLTNLGTNERKTAQADATGNYRFVELLPATYKVEVSAPGYKGFSRAPIPVQVDSTVRVDTPLQVGAVTETVQVTTQLPLLQTGSGTLGSVVEAKQIQEMPLNGRNPLNLMALVPGVIPQGSTQGAAGLNQTTHTNNQAWGNYQIGGNIAGQSAEYIDGAPITVYGNTIALVPTQDVIQEFKVATNAVSAEFGRFGGGVVEMTTRSGGNQLHGSLYEYVRNRVFNANDFFSNNAGLPRPEWDQNQYGVVASGPIKKDKAFFLFSWEGFNARLGIYTPAGVPSYNMEQGIFSKPITDPTGHCTIDTTTHPGKSTIPASCMDSTAVVLQGLFPAPSASNPDNTSFAGVPVAGSDTNQYTGRVDYNLGSKQRLFGRYTYWHLQDSSLDLYKGSKIFSGNAFSTNIAQQAVLGDTYTLSPSSILDVRLSYLREFYNNLPPTLGIDPLQFGAGPAALSLQQSYSTFPGVHLLGPDNFDNFFGPQVNSADTWNNYALGASLVKIKGSHTLKFGGEVRLLQRTGFGTNLLGSGSYTFLPITGDEYASFLMGLYNTAQITTVKPITNFEYAQGYYLADTWQATRSLNLNFGLRWELPGGIDEKQDRQTVILPHTADPVTGFNGAVVLVNSSLYGSRSVAPVRHDLFAPRLGFAYRLGSMTVIRGGYGLIYLPPDLVNGALASASPVNSATTTIAHPVYQGLQDPFGVLEGTKILQPTGRDPNFITGFAGQVVASPVAGGHFPYMQQWNLSVGRQIKGDLMVEVGYAGATGTHLPSEGNIGINELSSQYYSLGSALLNPVAPGSSTTLGQSLRPYPYFQDLQDSANYTANSSFNSMQVRTEKRFHNGGQLAAAFTWEKIIGNTDTTDIQAEPKAGGSNNGSAGLLQDYNNLAAERSILSYNMPRRLVINYVLPLPFGTGQKYGAGVSGVADKLVSGWAVNGITTFQDGFPMGLSENNPNALTQYFGGGTLRPNYTPGCKKTLPGSALSKFKSGQWFNAACFTDPGNFAFGNEPRVDGALTAQGVDNFDFAVLKSTKIRERAELQFRAEFFNIFNRVQFNPPGVAIDGAFYNQVASQDATPRLIQFSLRLNF